MAWAAAVAACLWWQTDYERGAGEVGDTPIDWPRQTAAGDLDPARSTIVLGLHPRCPCSAATLSELRRVCEPMADRVRVVVLVFGPEAAGPQWTQAPNCTAAASLPGARLVLDPNGAIAAKFGMLTSGHVAAYDPRGRLVFSGGVTGARGQVGDNDGAAALMAALDERPEHAGATAQVYGCPITTGCAAPPEVER